MKLYEKFIELLAEVNDENKTQQEHDFLVTKFHGWKDGVRDATGQSFNGDYHYIDLIDKGLIKDRPMCCGMFLDWESKLTNK